MPRGVKGTRVAKMGGGSKTGAFGQPNAKTDMALSKSFGGAAVERLSNKVSKTADPSLSLGLPGGSRVGRLAGEYGKSTIDQTGPDPMNIKGDA